VRISYQKKFAYLAIPKTGSSSVRALLDRYSDVRSDESETLFHHQPESQLRRLISSLGWDVRQFLFFTTVRNPWSRLFSTHTYWVSVAAATEEDYAHNPRFHSHCANYVRQGTDFSQRVRDLASQVPAQASYLLDPKETMVQPIRLEFLSEELEPIWKNLALDMSDLDDIPFLNRSSQADYREHYDKESIEVVAEAYASDVSRFGYSFDLGA